MENSIKNRYMIFLYHLIIILYISFCHAQFNPDLDISIENNYSNQISDIVLRLGQDQGQVLPASALVETNNGNFIFENIENGNIIGDGRLIKYNGDVIEFSIQVMATYKDTDSLDVFVNVTYSNTWYMPEGTIFADWTLINKSNDGGIYFNIDNPIFSTFLIDEAYEGYFLTVNLNQIFSVPSDPMLFNFNTISIYDDFYQQYFLFDVRDCLGIINGDNEEDMCGVCNGDNSSCSDCAGVPNGNSVVDNCGICDSDGSNDCVQDCAGVWGGNATIDECDLAIDDTLPSQIGITLIYPNPFNPQTTIEYAIDRYSHVSVSVFNTAGIEIETLVSEYNGIGNYSINWNGSKYPSGIYFIKLILGEYSQSQKLMLVK